MPKYFFDITENGENLRDTEGTDLPCPVAVRHEVLATLQDFARDKLPNTGERVVTIEVRDDGGSSVLRGELRVRLAEQRA